MFKNKISLSVALLAAAVSPSAFATDASIPTGGYVEANYNVYDKATAVIDYGNALWNPSLNYRKEGTSYSLRGGYDGGNWRVYGEINPNKKVNDKGVETGFINRNINVNPNGSRTQVNHVALSESSVGVGADYIWNINPNNRVFVGGSLRLIHQKGGIYSCGFPIDRHETSVWTYHNKKRVVPTFEVGYQYALNNGLYFGAETRYTPTVGGAHVGVRDYPGDAINPGDTKGVRFRNSMQVGVNIGYKF